jgi:hypothetical protein
MKLKKPYILFMLEPFMLEPFMLEPFMLEPPRPSRLEVLFELSDIQATSKKVWKIEKYKFSGDSPHG